MVFSLAQGGNIEKAWVSAMLAFSCCDDSNLPLWYVSIMALATV